MRKYFFIIAGLFAFSPGIALAQLPPIIIGIGGTGGAPGSLNTGSQFINFANNVLATANIIVTLLFVVALLVFVWGIIKYLVAAGDQNQVREARGFLLWGVIGIAVLASLFGLIVFLQTVFGVQGGTGPIQAPPITGSTVQGGRVIP